jgi:hypothetical protein
MIVLAVEGLAYYQAGGNGTCGSGGKMLCVGITAIFAAALHMFIL